MSITWPVRRFVGFSAVVGFVMTAAVSSSPIVAAAAPARPNAPSSTAANDPAARIAGLEALVASRESARAAEQVTRDQAVSRLAETHLAENAALARADLLGRAAIETQTADRATFV